MTADWYDIKFLESTTNIRDAVHRSFGRQPNAKIARDITVALQQGRLLFEAARSSPIEIRPMLVYYGVLSFARGVTAAINNVQLGMLSQSHGLKDVGSPTKIENMQVVLNKAGTFQEFNNAIAPLSVVNIGGGQKNSLYSQIFDDASRIEGGVKFRDIVARIPYLSDSFEKTFKSPPECQLVLLNHYNLKHWYAHIETAFVGPSRDDLRTAVGRIRTSYPFLQRLSLGEANFGYGRYNLQFDSFARGEVDDLSEFELLQTGEGQFIRSRKLSGLESEHIPMIDVIPPLSGGYRSNKYNYAIRPLNGAVLNEFSLQFLGIFLLGSLVRYRPQIWQHALSKSITSDAPPDDRALALVERFMDGVLLEFPGLVLGLFEGKHQH